MGNKQTEYETEYKTVYKSDHVKQSSLVPRTVVIACSALSHAARRREAIDKVSRADDEGKLEAVGHEAVSRFADAGFHLCLARVSHNESRSTVTYQSDKI